MTKNSKNSVSKLFAIVTVAIVMVASTVISVFFGTSSNGTADKKLSYATKVVGEFNDSFASKEFEASNEVYSKATAMALAFQKNANSDELDQMAKLLNLDSYYITDDKGVIVETNADGKGKSMKENEATSPFFKVFKGVSVKLMSEPQLNDDGTCTISASVNKINEGGVVVISLNSNSYAEILGKGLAEKCGMNTAIYKNDELVGSTFDNVEFTKDELTKTEFNKNDMTVKTAVVGDYTVVVGDTANGGSNTMMIVVANVILLAVAVAVIFIGAKKKNG